MKNIKDRSRRRKAIYQSHITFGYTLKEIADYLAMHYTTVSKIVKEVEGRG